MKVFVYGTLKKNYWNNRLLRNSKFLEEKEVPGYKLYYSSGSNGFPVAFPDKNSSIQGELFEIDDDKKELIINSLDALEGEGYIYSRVEIEKDIFMYVGIEKSWNIGKMAECPKIDGIYVWGYQNDNQLGD